MSIIFSPNMEDILFNLEAMFCSSRNLHAERYINQILDNKEGLEEYELCILDQLKKCNIPQLRKLVDKLLFDETLDLSNFQQTIQQTTDEPTTETQNMNINLESLD